MNTFSIGRFTVGPIADLLGTDLFPQLSRKCESWPRQVYLMQYKKRSNILFDTLRSQLFTKTDHTYRLLQDLFVLQKDIQEHI